MKLSIVIVSYNGREHVHKCLASLARHPQSGESEIVVVDNDGAGGGGLAESLRSRLGDRVRACFEARRGVAHARNRGLREARGEIVVLERLHQAEVTLRELDRLLARDGADPWCRFAAFTSLGSGAAAVVREWLGDPTTLDAAGARAALPGLVAQVARATGVDRHDLYDAAQNAFVPHADLRHVA